MERMCGECRRGEPQQREHTDERFHISSQSIEETKLSLFQRTVRIWPTAADCSSGLKAIASRSESHDDDHGSSDHQRRSDSAKRQSSLRMRLRERIAERY